MDIRATKLTESEQERFDAHVDDLFERLLDHVRAVLEDLENPRLQQLTYDLGFRENEVLPKRRARPQILIAHLVEQVYDALDPESDLRGPLLQFAITVQEYYDMLDDIADGDVADGEEPRVLTVTQLLMPLFVRRLNRFGREAVDYWAAGALRLAESVHEELRRPKTFDDYVDLLDEQSYFFGYATGVAAHAAGSPDEVDHAEAVGRCGYRYAQFMLDHGQIDEDDDQDWNAFHLADEPRRALEKMREWRDELDRLVAPFPDEQSHLIRAMFSVELDELEPEQ